MQCQAQAAAFAPLSSTVKPVKRARLLLDILLGLAGLYVVVFGALGFIGQLFFGKFSPSETAVSISGFIAVLFAAACRGIARCRAMVVIATLVALGCVAIDAIQYYRLHNFSGSSYAWDIRIPFILCLVVIGSAGFFVPSESRA